MRFQSYSQFTGHLDSLGLFRMTPGLERMELFLDACGGGRAARAGVQVAGTNGKGSTCAYLEALARAHGRSTGLYASPHLASVRERIRVDGRRLSRQAWTDLANRVYALCPDTDFSYFELLTCMAHLAFTRKTTDLAVLETGLGGTFDAVTALPADLVVFTPVSLDHCAVLGDTLAGIARDKAGAVRRGGPVLCAAQPAEAGREFVRAASARNAPLFAVDDVLNGRGVEPDFPGLADMPWFLRANARTAMAAWLLLCGMRGWTPDPEACLEALAETVVPGRMHRIPGDPGLILDGAHNPDGLAALKRALEELGVRPSALVFACMADKDVDAMAALARTLTDGPVFVPALDAGGRGADPDALADKLGPRAVAVLDPASALDAALKAAGSGSGPVLAAGSLYLLAEIYTQQPWLANAGPALDRDDAEPHGE